MCNDDHGDQNKKNQLIEDCAQAESALIRFYDETPSFKIQILPR